MPTIEHRAFVRVVREAGKTDAKRATFIASTDLEARDGMIIDQATWRLDGHRSNPVILWAHDYSHPPIGKATRLEIKDGRLEVDIEWDTESPMGALVARQVAEGFLNAVSVGWGSARYLVRSNLEKNDKYYSEAGGYVVRDPELLEISVVPVPADAAALVQRGANSTGAYLDGLLAWVRANVPTPADDDRLPWLRSEDDDTEDEADPDALPWLRSE